ncbi:MAG: DUF790 family protein, partial [Conexivisphaera sp.]
MNLLRVRVRKGIARPAYLSPEDLAAVREVMGAFQEASEGGWRRAELEDRISYLSEIHDHRLVRGLARLMERRITLSQRSAVPPAEVRRLLFSAGPILSREEREELLASVASRFGVSIADVESAMFADAERERVVASLSPVSEEELAAWYNAELAETMLARSLSL